MVDKAYQEKNKKLEEYNKSLLTFCDSKINSADQFINPQVSQLRKLKSAGPESTKVANKILDNLVGVFFWLRIVDPLLDLLLYIQKNNNRIQYVGKNYANYYSVIGSYEPLSPHEIFSTVVTEFEAGNQGLADRLAAGFPGMNLVEAVAAKNEKQFCDILSSDSDKQEIIGRNLAFSKDKNALERIEVCHLLRVNELDMVSLRNRMSDLLTQSRFPGTLLSKRMEVVPYEDVSHDFRILVFDFLKNYDNFSKGEVEAIEKILLNTNAKSAYLKTKSDFLSGVLEKEILEEVNQIEVRIGTDIFGGAAVLNTWFMSDEEVDKIANGTEPKTGLINTCQGNSVEEKPAPTVNWPTDWFGEDEGLWNNIPIKIANSQECIRRIYDVLVKNGYIENSQDNLDKLVCFLTRRKTIQVVSPLKWMSTKENLCYFIDKVASGDTRRWKKSVNLFCYADKSAFQSNGASKNSESTSVPTDFKNDLADAIT